MGTRPQPRAMTLTIYSYPGSFRVQKALIAAKYVGVDIATPEFEFGKDNKSKEFLAKNPLGKVPVLETDKGYLFESGAILRYVARLAPAAGLMGSSFYEQALVDQWADFATSDLDGVLAPWVYPITIPGFPHDATAAAQSKAKASKALESLNKYLEAHTFLAGERITAADIAVCGSLLQPFQTVMDDSYRKQYPNVVRWFMTCVNQPNFKAVLGNVIPVDKAYTA